LFGEDEKAVFELLRGWGNIDKGGFEDKKSI
jgi:hypothetical protein